MNFKRHLCLALLTFLVIGCSSRVVTYQEPTSGPTAELKLINSYGNAYLNTYEDTSNCSGRDVMVDYNYGDSHYKSIVAGQEFAFTLQSGSDWETKCNVAGSFVPKAGELYDLEVEYSYDECNVKLMQVDQSNFRDKTEVAFKAMQFSKPENEKHSWCNT